MSDERFAVQRTQITRVGRLRTALMLTDLVGYSRRMHADEPHAVDELRLHYELVRTQLEAHHGREVKTIGDSFLAEFPVADDALRCAVAIQSEMTKAFDGADPLQVRIGLHVAEVEAIGPDVIGDGVNILSRIEPLAAAGGICASKDFLDACTGRPVPFSPMGPVEVKNISSPIELFAWPAPTGRDAQSTEGDPAADDGVPTKFIRGPKSVPSLSAAPPAPALAPGEDAPTILHRSVPAAGATQPDTRPLAKSSGIFSPRISREAFPETSTVVVPDVSEPLLPDVPSVRSQQSTREAPPSEDGTVTGPRPDADPYEADLEEQTGTLTGPRDELPEVRIPPPHKPRGVLIAVGSVAGVAVALTLVVVGLLVGKAAKRSADVPPADTTVVQVAPPPAAVAPAPPPVPTPPPPVAVAPPAAVAPPPPPKPKGLDELVAQAKHNISADKHIKPKRRKQLFGDLNKLEGKYKRARGKDKARAEKALRGYLKKHHLP